MPAKRHRQPELPAKRGGAQQRRHAARLDQLEIDAGDDAGLSQRQDFVGAGNGLVAADRQQAEPVERAHGRNLIVRQRLLKKQQRGAFDASQILLRLARRPSGIGVGAQYHVGSELGAHLQRSLDLFFDAFHAHLELEKIVALADLAFGFGDVGGDVGIAQQPHVADRAAHRPADQLDARHAQMLADQVEQRDLDGGLGAAIVLDARAAALRERRAVERVGADQQRRHVLAHRGDHAGQGIAGHGGRHRRLAPADQAVLRLEPDDEIVRLGDAFRRHDHRLGQRQRDGDGVRAPDEQWTGVLLGGDPGLQIHGFLLRHRWLLHGILGDAGHGANRKFRSLAVKRNRLQPSPIAFADGKSQPLRRQSNALLRNFGGAIDFTACLVLEFFCGGDETKWSRFCATR